MKYGLSDKDVRRIKTVFTNFPSVHEAILYGSRAKGNFKQNSDIDISLKGKKLSFKDLIKISLELDDLMTPYDFDLSLYDDIDNEGLVDHINRVGKILFVRADQI